MLPQTKAWVNAYVQKTFENLPDHLSVHVIVSFLRIDSWDNEVGCVL